MATKEQKPAVDETNPGADDQKPVKPEKVRKITDKDFKRAEQVLKAELDKRKSSPFRKKHEERWLEVDRQVSLDSPDDVDTPEGEEWLNVFELGVLAQASEIMTADLLRVVFPDSRAWFEAHVEPPVDLDTTTGDATPVDKKMQSMLDGRLRSMMTQQHRMFNLRDRVELSMKEALHHGGFVVEVAKDSMDMYLTGSKVKEIRAPVWKCHSMWNCYPDPSPSLVGSNMFYTGSMFVEYFQPRHKFMDTTKAGDGWIAGGLKKIKKVEHETKGGQTKDLKITVFWGDVIIPASGDGMSSSADDMVFPNHKAMLANGVLVYLEENETPYPPIIYKGYERMDVRDPYATSPIIKQSPMQSITSILANEFVNSVQLHARPPIVYDGNDPDFVVNGGPTISPGAKTSTKGSATFKELKIGDPNVALSGAQFGITSMKEALGRPGIEVGSRATKAEVDTKQADSEAGPFGFATKVDDALRTFLYMQHAMNLADKEFKFSYYNPELDSPDFLRVEHKDLPESVHFEVVGSKGMLGEARRHQAFSTATAFMSSNPLMAPNLEIEEIMKQMYQDAGVKAPERFLKQSDGIPPEVKQKLEQMTQLIQQLQQALKDSESLIAVKTQKMQLDYEAKMQKIQTQHAADVADVQIRAAKVQSDHEIATGKQVHDAKTAKLEQIIREFEHRVELTVAKYSGGAVKEPEPALGDGSDNLPPVEGVMGIVGGGEQ